MRSQVPAVNFMGTILANVDNENLSDAEFRDFIRTSLYIVEKPMMESIECDPDDHRPTFSKYYV